MNSLTKKWITKAGLPAMLIEDRGTTCHVGVESTSRLYQMLRKPLMAAVPDLLTVLATEVTRAGMIMEGVDDPDHLWWFSFPIAGDLRAAEAEALAESFARVMAAAEKR